MATYRPLRIAPDLPNSDPRFDDDTPPASPYQNRLPPKPRPALRVGSLFSITLPRPQTLVGVGLILLSLGWLFTPRRYKPVLRHPKHEPSLRYKNVDWRLFAYTTYATDRDHMCAALMLFDQLDALGSRAQRVLFYPHDWDEVPQHIPAHADKMLEVVRSNYGVKTVPVQVKGARMEVDEDPRLGRHRYQIPNSGAVLDPSVTKFQTILQDQYLRLIHLDPDVSLLKHLDDLFLGPDARIALTRRYTSTTPNKQLSAHLFMVEPRDGDYAFLEDLVKKSGRADDHFDGQVLTEQFGDSAMILSHRRYGLNTLEFRRSDHYDFMGNEWEEWNPERALREASLIYFDEEPIPKPWINLPHDLPSGILPACDFGAADSDKDINCRNRVIWSKLYNDYKERRKEVCRMPPIGASPWKSGSE